MEFYRTKVVRQSRVKETFIKQYNGSLEATLKAGRKEAIEQATINQGDTLLVYVMDCYSFPQKWSLDTIHIAGTDLKVTTTFMSNV